MRVIPKRTKVRLELFKGIEVVDVLVGAAGVGLAISLMFSNLPGKYIMMVIVLLLTVSMVRPVMSASIWQVTGDAAPPPTKRIVSEVFTFLLSHSNNQRK